MQQKREDFHGFLKRVASNQLLADDWQQFTATPYENETMESLRSALVERAQCYQELVVGWIPQDVQDFANDLASALSDFDGEKIFYRTNCFEFDEQRRLTIRASRWEIFGHSICTITIDPENSDYPFWCWIVENPERREGVKNSGQIAALRHEFSRKA
ncbi:MAG: hypothetical protein ACO1RA_00790 [Planctomycetaceae bacterium]